MPELKIFESPFEILELEDRGVMDLEVVKWELGKTVIKTAIVPEGKEIKALRVWVPKEKKPIGVDWWDITSQTLIAQLLPYLEKKAYREYIYRITKFGVAPKARFTLEVTPKK